jgi:hypothetical protein
MNNFYQEKITTGKNFLLSRVATNKYRITSSVENQNIYMQNILNFNLVSLMYQTNLDKFEKVQLDIDTLNENRAKVFLLVKHLLKEFGLKQRYVSFDIIKQTYDNGVKFILTQNPDYGKILNNCSNASLLPITNILYDFKLETPHKLVISQDIQFSLDVDIPKFLEPLFGAIMKSMHKKTLRFIREINPGIL